MKKKKVLLAMSGGVDSSVSAIILKENGFYVEAAYMKNWEEDNNKEYCSSKSDLKYLDYICRKLEIKLNIFNFSYEYWNKVFQPFIKKYKKNLLLNPDILCNKNIKFNIFLNYAIKNLNFDLIATGHYANIKKLKNDKFVLKKHFDKYKDQTYFLYNIKNEELKYVLFPLTNYDKQDVRIIAKKHGLLNYSRKDSTGICFIGKRKFNEFIKKYVKHTPGNIITLENEIIGVHNGIFNYNLGQRKGLNISNKKKYLNESWYVFNKNKKKNELIVVQGSKNPLLFKSIIFIVDSYFVFNINKFKKINCKAKIRHSYKETKVKINFSKFEKHKVIFNISQRSLNPGQTIVFYKNNLCIGGGTLVYS